MRSHSARKLFPLGFVPTRIGRNLCQKATQIRPHCTSQMLIYVCKIITQATAYDCGYACNCHVAEVPHIYANIASLNRPRLHSGPPAHRHNPTWQPASQKQCCSTPVLVHVTLESRVPLCTFHTTCTYCTYVHTWETPRGQGRLCCILSKPFE
eukprot:jgi/Botrbrau1/2369/Bobra.0395s0004.1